MLSYRHGYHAGNHADVLKHAVVLQIIQYLKQKEKAFTVFDTHAGAGLYDFESTFAQKNKEYESGVAKLWKIEKPHSALLADYLNMVKQFNPNGRLRNYPGSPLIAQQTIRHQDSIKLFELHSSEAPALSDSSQKIENMSRTQVIEADGLKAILPFLPPPSRRAVTLIDPSYEQREEYAAVSHCLSKASKRFAGGVYVVWYPCINKDESINFSSQLSRQTEHAWLNVELHVSTQNDKGMQGSGLFVVNPPWTLAGALNEALPELVKLLGADNTAKFVLTSHEV